MDVICASLEPFDHVRLAYVFGSAVSGCLRPNSDVDVGILCSTPPTPRALDHLNELLASAAQRRVDLVDLLNAPPLLAHEIIGHGRCVLSRDPAERAEFETRVIRRFVDTAYLRRIHYEALHERSRHGP